MKKLSILLLVALLSFSFVACGDDDESYIVSFTADGNSKLQVNNQDNTKLVLFKDDVSQSSLLGGVPGSAQAFGVPLNGATGLFVLNVVTYDDYARNGINAKIVYSTLVYVDNIAAQYPVAASMVGSGEITIINNTDAYIEIRETSWYGTTFTVVRPHERKPMNLPSRDIFLFPIAKIEKKMAGVTVGLSEKVLTDYADMFSINDNTSMQWTLENSIVDSAKHTAAYVRVVNNTDKGAEFFSGTGAAVNKLKNSLGRSVINNGSELGVVYFPIGASDDGQDFNVSFKNVSGTTVASKTVNFKNGLVYNLTVTPGNIASAEAGTFETIYP